RRTIAKSFGSWHASSRRNWDSARRTPNRAARKAASSARRATAWRRRSVDWVRWFHGTRLAEGSLGFLAPEFARSLLFLGLQHVQDLILGQGTLARAGFHDQPAACLPHDLTFNLVRRGSNFARYHDLGAGCGEASLLGAGSVRYGCRGAVSALLRDADRGAYLRRSAVETSQGSVILAGHPCGVFRSGLGGQRVRHFRLDRAFVARAPGQAPG